MVEYDKKRNNSSSGGSSSSRNATLWFQFEDRARQQTVFESSEKRAREAVTDNIGTPVQHVLDDCHHHFDTGEWAIEGQKVYDLTHSMMSKVQDDMKGRMSSQGVPDDCATEFAREYVKSAYTFRINPTYTTGGSGFVEADKLNSPAEMLHLFVAFDSPQNISTVKRNLAHTISMQVERGQIEKHFHSQQAGVFHNFSARVSKGSKVSQFCLSKTGGLDLMWALRTVSEINMMFSDIDLMEFRASPNMSWDVDGVCGTNISGGSQGDTSFEDYTEELPEGDNGEDGENSDLDFVDVSSEDEDG